jgi:hypothetical protein
VTAWMAHQDRRIDCSRDIDSHASRAVGTGRDAGRVRAGRGGGSWKIWCCVEMLECLYRCPRRCPNFCIAN